MAHKDNLIVCTKCWQVVSIIGQWLDREGHDLCHDSSGVIIAIAKLYKIDMTLFDIKKKIGKVTEPEFRAACDQYCKEIFHARTV